MEPRQLFLYLDAGLVRKGISEIALNNRIYNLCTDNVIEDEMHFLLCCVFYSDARKPLLAKAQLCNRDSHNMSLHDIFFSS